MGYSQIPLFRITSFILPATMLTTCGVFVSRIQASMLESGCCEMYSVLAAKCVPLSMAIRAECVPGISKFSGGVR